MIHNYNYNCNFREYALKMQKNRKCMHCFMEFKNVSSFVAHLANSHHPTVSFSTSSIDSKSGEPICVDCRKGFSSIKMLQQHLQQPCKQYWASEEQGNAVSTPNSHSDNFLSKKGDFCEYPIRSIVKISKYKRIQTPSN